MFGINLLLQGEAILLKRIDDFLQEAVRSQGGYKIIDLDSSPMFAISNEIELFINALILHFRLLRTGNPDYIFQFQIAKESRSIYSRKTREKFKPYSAMTFDMSAQELGILKSRLESKAELVYKENKLIELALNNFNLSYDIIDLKTRFVTLTTSLESLFNYGKGEITHIISRHLALVVSSNKDEFYFNCKAIKKLYGVRSAIVHGSTQSADLMGLILQLEDYVRRAINYCSTLSDTLFPDTKALFEFLNSAGYSH